VSARVIPYGNRSSYIRTRESRNICPYDSVRVRVRPWGQTMQMCWPYGDGVKAIGSTAAVIYRRDVMKRACCIARRTHQSCCRRGKREREPTSPNQTCNFQTTATHASRKSSYIVQLAHFTSSLSNICIPLQLDLTSILVAQHRPGCSALAAVAITAQGLPISPHHSGEHLSGVRISRFGVIGAYKNTPQSNHSPCSNYTASPTFFHELFPSEYSCHEPGSSPVQSAVPCDCLPRSYFHPDSLSFLLVDRVDRFWSPGAIVFQISPPTSFCPSYEPGC
jgi:hypothetical protein